MIERPRFTVDMREIIPDVDKKKLRKLGEGSSFNFEQIISGWFNWLFISPTELTKKHRSICKGCEFNKRNKWLFWIRLCTACGCVIKAKTACKDCECIKGKW